MELFGLAGTTLAAVFAAVAAALVALHFLRRKRRELVVPFVELFVRDAADARAASRVSRRLLWLSLLLLLAIAALLVLAMGDPRSALRRRDERNVAIWIDVSRSMGSVEDGRSRLSRAREHARRIVRSLGENERAIVVAVSAEPEARSPLTDDRETLLRALDTLEPEDVHEDLGRAATLTNDLLAGRARPRVILLGDAATPDDPGLAQLDRRIALQARAFGRARENVGITAFSARRYRRDRSQAEILVGLRNADEVARRYELVLEAEGRVLDVRSLAIEAGAERFETLRHVGGAGSSFHARIRPIDGRADVLAADDRADATLPPRRRLRVLLVSERDLYLEAALLLDESVQPSLVSPAAYAGTEGFDLVVFDHVVPRLAPSAPMLFVGIPPEGPGFAPFETRGEVASPRPTRVEREDPLLRGVAIDDVVIGRAPKLVPRAGDAVLVASRDAPLVVRGAREGQPMLALAFDLRDSDLPLRMAFPILVVRAIEELGGGTGELEEAFRTDAVARIAFETSASHVSVVDPRGRAIEAPVVDGFVVFQPRHAGLHRIEDGATSRTVAASLGPVDETRVRPGRYLRGASAVRAPVVGPGVASRRPWAWLVLAALALLLLEWQAHHRRWTA